jgi:hypothetical protein
MAEKLSIHIDLRDSKPVQTAQNKKPAKKLILPDTVEKNSRRTQSTDYHYHYDRIAFVSLIAVLLLLIVIWLLFANNTDTTNESVQTPLNKKHLVAEPEPVEVTETRAVIKNQPIFLHYEKIDVIKHFSIPLQVIDKKIENKQVVEEKSVVNSEIKTENAPLSKTAANKKNADDKIKSTAQSLSEKPKKPVVNIFTSKLSRVVLAGGVYQKEPNNLLDYQVTGSSQKAQKVYLFTQLNDSAGESFRHEWWYDGQLIHTIKFKAFGKRWRCFSTKNLGKFQQGEWMVKVVNQKDQLLSTVTFNYKVI